MLTICLCHDLINRIDVHSVLLVVLPSQHFVLDFIYVFFDVFQYTSRDNPSEKVQLSDRGFYQLPYIVKHDFETDLFLTPEGVKQLFRICIQL